MAQWDRMWQFAKDEINTFDINSKDAYGSQLRIRMKEHIANDISTLENLIGEEVTDEDLVYIAQHNPNIFLGILKKIFNYLLYIARLPVDWKNEMETINNFEQVINKIVDADREQNKGEV